MSLTSDGKVYRGDLVALPMHGEVKLRAEGYRTRDGHVLEWVARLRPELSVTVRSRPEPFPRLSLARRTGSVNSDWRWQSPQPLTVPPMRSRREWWVKSLAYEPGEKEAFRSALVWNPVAGAELIGTVLHCERVVVDLLDDWSKHVLFAPIRTEVETSYRKLFEIADVVTANSEGTVELARRFGRNAILLPNGCDPERFNCEPDRRASGGQRVVGYAGKLSERLDLELVESVASAFPGVRFDFAGPYTAASRASVSSIRTALERHENINLLGDIEYDQLPSLFSGWDMGWVPHRVGEGEVGGDVMKIYEYRASGLPTVITPIIGVDRALPSVRVANGVDETVASIAGVLGRPDEARPRREFSEIPPAMTWKSKTQLLLEYTGL